MTQDEFDADVHAIKMKVGPSLHGHSLVAVMYALLELVLEAIPDAEYQALFVDILSELMEAEDEALVAAQNVRVH